jgi:hypothetical protein
MLRILKDCIFAGTSVHAGEIYPADQFDKKCVQVIVGAGFAELCTPEPEEDVIAEEPEDFTVAPVKTEPAVKKTTRKKKK